MLLTFKALHNLAPLYCSKLLIITLTYSLILFCHLTQFTICSLDYCGVLSLQPFCLMPLEISTTRHLQYRKITNPQILSENTPCQTDISGLILTLMVTPTLSVALMMIHLRIFQMTNQLNYTESCSTGWFGFFYKLCNLQNICKTVLITSPSIWDFHWSNSWRWWQCVNTIIDRAFNYWRKPTRTFRVCLRLLKQLPLWLRIDCVWAVKGEGLHSASQSHLNK